jgi:hypothetical protein
MMQVLGVHDDGFRPPKHVGGNIICTRIFALLEQVVGCLISILLCTE